MALFDAATDRLSDAFEQDVEAARLGALFASGKAGSRAYDKWRSSRARASGRPRRSSALSGAALEGAIRGFARNHPEYVVFEKVA